MEKHHYNLIAIIGPTASGKSDLAISLAKKYDGEIISADSRQVYRGMDIGTGKVPRDLSVISNFQFPLAASRVRGQAISKRKNADYFSEGVRHHLIDVASPRREYNISHFLRDAKKAIAGIEKRGKMPIICGGTHFWIQAILSDQAIPKVKPDKVLRAKLERKTVEELFTMLQEKDPARAETIDAYNKFRLVRALEIVDILGKVPPILKNQESRIKNQEMLIIALSPEKEILRERIRIRLEKRFNEGMIEEVRELRSSGISWKRLESFGLEYRYIAQFLQEKISEAEMRERLFFEIWHYAKRQLSWIRRWEKQGAEIYQIESEKEGLAIIAKNLSRKEKKA